MSFFDELKRRHVIRVATAYVVTAWLLIQVSETVLPVFGFSDLALRVVIMFLAIGLVPAVVLTWAFEWTPEGLEREEEVDRFTRESLEKAGALYRRVLEIDPDYLPTLKGLAEILANQAGLGFIPLEGNVARAWELVLRAAEFPGNSSAPFRSISRLEIECRDCNLGRIGKTRRKQPCSLAHTQSSTARVLNWTGHSCAMSWG